MTQVPSTQNQSLPITPMVDDKKNVTRGWRQWFTRNNLPWTAFTTAVVSTGGAFGAATASGLFRLDGKTCFFFIIITITNNNTGSGFIEFTLPVAAAAVMGGVATGRANAVSGKMLQGFVSNSSPNTMVVANYDNTYPASTGEVLLLSGVYETT